MQVSGYPTQGSGQKNEPQAIAAVHPNGAEAPERSDLNIDYDQDRSDGEHLRLEDENRFDKAMRVSRERERKNAEAERRI